MELETITPSFAVSRAILSSLAHLNIVEGRSYIYEGGEYLGLGEGE